MKTRLPELTLSCALALAGLIACGKMDPTPDAGNGNTDAGMQAMDSGVADSGLAPQCLADKLDAGPADAGWDGGYDFSCLGQPRETGGQALLELKGFTTRANFTRTRLSGITLDLLTTDGTVVASTVSAGDAGEYVITADAGCLPFAGEVRATSTDADAGFAPAYAVPDGPWTHDRGNLELVMFDSSTQSLAAAIANVTLVDGGSALALTVEDCAGHSVEGVTLDVGDAGVVRYVGSAGLPVSQLTATSSEGQAVIFNIFASSVTVKASRNGSVLVERAVPMHPASVTGTTLSP